MNANDPGSTIEGLRWRLERLRDRLAESRASGGQAGPSELEEMLQATEELRRRLELDELIRSISTSFINVEPEQIDQQIQHALKAVAQAAGAERGIVFLFSQDGTKVSNTHEWWAEGAAPLMPEQQNMPVEQFAWAARQIRDRRVIHVPRVAELHDSLSEKRHWQAEGIKSLLNVPMALGTGVVGFLGLNCFAAETSWPEETIRMLRTVGEIFANALARKRAEQALREQRDRAQMYLDVAGVIFVLLRPDQTVAMINRKGCQVLGYEEEEIVGRNWFETFLPEGVREKVQAVFSRMMAGELEPVEYYENPVLTRSGQARTIAWHNSILRDESGRVVAALSSGEDITERRQAEEAVDQRDQQLRRAATMEAIGRLAGGIAHDFNNTLGIIKGYTDLLARSLPADDSRREDIQTIRAATERAAALTRQLLALGRRQVVQPRVLGLNETMLATEALLRRTIGRDVELVTLPREGLWYVRADPTQIEQVLLNLVVNAREAMPRGGQITIETRNADIDTETATLYPGLVPGQYVMLAVSDTGVGMSPEVRAHVFEPFYTTKPSGEGAGLGLSTVYGIVTQHGGHISVYSEPGKGSTFRIYLPRAKEEPAGPPSPDAAPPAGKEMPRGSETVLVVEDDPDGRELTCRVLREQGYEVLSAGDAEQALALVAEQPQRVIHLLVTDVVMPEAGGEKLADRFRALRPAARVLFISGYPDEALVRRGALPAGVNFLSKPFSPRRLAETVRRVLDADSDESGGPEKVTQPAAEP